MLDLKLELCVVMKFHERKEKEKKKMRRIARVFHITP